MANEYIPDRGDIAWLVLEPRVGHEQSGRRPVLVLSPRELARHTSLAIVCPITSRIKGLPYEVVLKDTKTEGAVLPFHVKSVDFRERKIKFIEHAPEAIVARVTKGVQNAIMA